MTPVPASITINFTARYTGAHRACYRIGNSGSYTCVTTSCVQGPCVATIPIFVDNETCDSIQFEGYLQAECQDINSLVDRVPFSNTFTPSPACKLYTVTCINSSVSSATMTNVGSGYNPEVVPSLIFTGGVGTGATGTAVVGFGAIIVGSVNSITPGSGYANGIHINVPITGGSGSGGQATVTVSGGIITVISITSVGTGYQTSDTLGLNDTAMGGAPSIEASFKIISDYGKVNSITITSQGSGYTSSPTITIAAPVGGGTTATATAVLANCPAITSDGCSGGNVVIPSNSIIVGTVLSVCNIGGPVTPGNQYSVVQNGNCLCNCVSATIGVSGTVSTQVRYFYNRCGAGMQSGILTVGGSPSSIIDCIVPGSLVFETLHAGTIGTVTYHGSC